MTDKTQGALSGRLRQLSSELRDVGLALKEGATPELQLLQEFRQVLDNVRMAAWTVNELLNAAELQKDTDKVLSFLAAERLRRSNQMLKDLCADLNDQGVTWQTNGVHGLFETVNVLQVQLSKLINQDRGWFEKVSDSSR
ncbi:MAG: hypothetical protein LAO78_12530 [Acidobacteriia bacterium]|nr:hypothetical protein [Terriglobia bacterium]